MAKSLTIRVEDNIYLLFKKAADGQKRTISNYIEWAAMNYLMEEMYVSDEEMEEIMENADDLRKGIQDVKEGKYRIVG